MEAVKEYTLVTGHTPGELIVEVNFKISQGWRPIGGISVINESPLPISDITNKEEDETKQLSIAHQAMVR